MNIKSILRDLCIIINDKCISAAPRGKERQSRTVVSVKTLPTDLVCSFLFTTSYIYRSYIHSLTAWQYEYSCVHSPTRTHIHTVYLMKWYDLRKWHQTGKLSSSSSIWSDQISEFQDLLYMKALLYSKVASGTIHLTNSAAFGWWLVIISIPEWVWWSQKLSATVGLIICSKITTVAALIPRTHAKVQAQHSCTNTRTYVTTEAADNFQWPVSTQVR